MLALVHADFLVFLHVLGAMLLVGAVAATALAASRAGASVLLRRVAFKTMVFVTLPAWVVMRVVGQWVESREDIPDDPTWLGIGFIVGDAGLVVLLGTTILAWWSVRRPDRRWPAQAVAVLALLYLVALGIAWWAMTTRPGA
jgi:hypothetical protein